MGFWNDYWKFGLGDKFNSTLGGIIMRGKLGDLIKKYGTNVDPTQQQSPNVSTGTDSSYDKTLGQPKQDINQQPKPNYTAPPTIGGQPNVETQGNYEFKQDENPPLGESPFMQSIAGNTQSPPLISNTDKNKINSEGLSMMLDPTKRQKHNEQLNNDVMRFLLESTRFKDNEKYGNIAQLLLGSKTWNAPVPPKFEPKQDFTDKNGLLYRYEYNPYKSKYEPVPVMDDNNKQIQTKLPEMQDLSKLNYYEGDNGNAWYKDPYTQEGKDTGVEYNKWDKTYNLKEQELGLKQAEFEAKLEGGMFTKKDGKSGNGDGTGTTTNSTGTGKYLHVSDADGNPLELTQLPAPIQTLIRNLGSTKAKVVADAKSKIDEWARQYGNTVDYSNESPTIEKAVEDDVIKLNMLYNNGKMDKTTYDKKVEEITKQAPYTYKKVVSKLGNLKENARTKHKKEGDVNFEWGINPYNPKK